MEKNKPSKNSMTVTPDLNDLFLGEQRILTDRLADEAVLALFQQGGNVHFSKLMTELSHNNDTLPSGLPDAVHLFFQEGCHLPSWASPAKMRSGQLFFSSHAHEIMLLLGLLSLPYCYAAADGAQVLYLSEKIRNNPAKRLAETSEFVFDIMAPDAFEKRGKGIMSIQKVRLLHAAVRFHIIKSGKWNGAWGNPVNQEDMAGTNLAFSFIVIRGLRKIGKALSPDDTKAFLHLWNVIGSLMGIKDELLPGTIKEAYTLDQAISRRHFKSSEAGVALTAALLAHYNASSTDAPVPIAAFMRFLLGNNVADLLGLPVSPFPDRLLQPLLMASNLRNMGSNIGSGYYSAKNHFRDQLKMEHRGTVTNFHQPGV